MTTATDAPARDFRPDQPVHIAFPGAVADRDGFYVEPGDTPGTVRVRYETKSGEKFREVPADRVTALDAPPAPPAAEPAKGPKPTGELVSFMRLAAVINERGLHDGEDATRAIGGVYNNVNAQIRGEQVPHPFPYRIVNGWKCVDLAEGMAWWVARNERNATRARNAEQRRHAESPEVRAARKAAKAAEREHAAAQAKLDALLGRADDLARKISEARSALGAAHVVRLDALAAVELSRTAAETADA